MSTPEGMGAAPEQVPQSTPQPATPQIPAGQRLVPDSEYQRLLRIEEGYKGQTPTLKALGEIGLKSADDVSEFGQVYKRAREMGIDLGRLLPSDNPAGQPQISQPNFDVDSFRREIIGEVRRESASASHEAASESERRLASSLMTKLAGNASDEDTKFLVAAVVNEAMAHSSQLYPKGHPLEGQLRPLTQEEFAAVENVVSKRWSAMRGRQMQDIASNAGRAVPAPASGSQGAATPNSGPALRPGGLPPKQSVQEYFDKLRAARQGAPLSQG